MKTIILAAILLLSAMPVLAEGSPAKFSARVKVSISSSDDISAKVESFIDRELRSLGDVVITDKHPRWVLEVLAMTVKSKSGYKSGVAFSVVVLQPFNNSFLKKTSKARYIEFVRRLTNGLDTVSEHWIQVGSTEDLRSVCSDIVAQFDTQELAPARKFWRELNSSKK